MASLDELRTAVAQGRSALRQAVEVATEGWEQTRSPRPGEDEAWSPRETAEHAIGAEVAFAGAVAEAIGSERPPRTPLVLETPEAALSAIDEAALLADPVFEALEPRHLEMETRFADNVEGVLRLAAGHLREHAQQIAGVE